MDTEQFLQSVLSDDGYYCLFSVHQSKKKAPEQKFYETIPDVLSAAQDMDAKGYDTFFALGTFVDANSRKTFNVKYLKSFYLDIDCGDGKPYPTQSAGIHALQDFCREAELPAPITVNSGRGIHAYWAFTKPVPYAQWLPVAERLKSRCVELGFEVDPVVTSDGARVLRVPDTHNHKDSPPKPTSVVGKKLRSPVDFDKLADILGCEPVAEPTLFDLAPGARELIKGNSAHDALAGVTQSRFQTILKKSIAGEGCEQILIIATQQTTIEEPLWRAGLSIANCCVDKVKAAEKISNKHPQYNAEETRDKMAGTEGPYHCATFDATNPGVCVNCPNFGKITSPIVLGRELDKSKVYDPDTEVAEGQGVLVDEPYDVMVHTRPTPPKPYYLGANGGLVVDEIVKGVNGAKDSTAPAIIYKNDLYPVKLIMSTETGAGVIFRHRLPKEAEKEFMIPFEHLADPLSLRRVLTREGIMVDNKHLPMCLFRWVQQLQEENKMQQENTQFGWLDTVDEETGDKQYEGFIVGNRIIQPGGGSIENHANGECEDLFPAFRPKGTLEGWKLAANFYCQDGMEPYQFAMGTAFGSPLMGLLDTGITMAGIHMWGAGSGEGKTTGLWASASVWGDYEDLVIHADSTHNFTMNRCETYKSIPFNVDELTSASPEQLTKYILAMTAGKQRGRMAGQANKERARGKGWSLIGLSTGNKSVVEAVSLIKATTEAEAMRMLEIHVPDYLKVKLTKVQGAEISSLLTHNQGHAGVIFIEYVMANLELVKQQLRMTNVELDILCNLQNKHRYWSAGLAATVTGMRISNMLGLTNFDMPKILAFIQSVVADNIQSGEHAAQTPQDILAKYLREQGTRIITVTGTGRKKVHVGHMPTQGVMGRHEPDEHKLMLPVSAFREWCIPKQISYEQTVTYFVEHMNAVATGNTERLYSFTEAKNRDPEKCITFHDYGKGVAVAAQDIN